MVGPSEKPKEENIMQHFLVISVVYSHKEPSVTLRLLLLSAFLYPSWGSFPYNQKLTYISMGNPCESPEVMVSGNFSTFLLFGSYLKIFYLLGTIPNDSPLWIGPES